VHDPAMVRRRQFGVREGGRCRLRGEPSRAGACTADEDSRSAAGDEDVFAAVVVERLSVEATESPSPAASRSPSHSFLVAHRSELVALSSSVMCLWLSPTAYRTVSGSGSSSN
jgi:hypothetical protein